ncbi:membrane protein [Robbsia andropogonis]|uniref:Membrane protein n=1 Tax=Robbsia andropogonis TaxID=28092 RepID=A0A0F5K2F4_9BURK|nr:DUF1656 domain-containing protein [Robbsia andropogonis]KKB64278.1 membrane protein [Robbsia andropogonis]MCP1118872.1 DUF1656 domain-containing protein [Robbsia andropogonis]MCP1128339.1 DUF1656 domain-containing protein [Robbsia andropogonis]
MIGEFDIYGVFIPELLVWMLLAYGLLRLVTMGFARWRFYRHVWHRSMFDLGIYVILLGLVVFVSYLFRTG